MRLDLHIAAAVICEQITYRRIDMHIKQYPSVFLAAAVLSLTYPAVFPVSAESTLEIHPSTDPTAQAADTAAPVSQDTDTEELTSEITDSEVPASEDTSSLQPESPDEYTPGLYIGGKTIPAGEYMLFAMNGTGSCRVRTRTEDSISTMTETFDYNAIIVFSENQLIRLENCRAVPINLVNNAELVTSGHGMFKMGMHIPAGDYRIDADPGITGYMTIYSTVPGDPAAAPVPVGSGTFRLNNGQYVKLEGCHFAAPPETIVHEITDKESVLHVQAQLNGLGYDCGIPDGVSGERTRAAISQYQEDRSLSVNGKIDRNLQLLLDIEIPFSEVQAELPPYMIDTAEFAERYNEGIRQIRPTRSGLFSTISLNRISSGEFSPEEDYTIVLEMNHAVSRIKNAFFITKKASLDRHAVGLMAVFFYGIDRSFESAVTARDFVLRLLFDGSASSGSFEYSILPLNEGYNIWIRIPEA